MRIRLQQFCGFLTNNWCPDPNFLRSCLRRSKYRQVFLVESLAKHKHSQTCTIDGNLEMHEIAQQFWNLLTKFFFYSEKKLDFSTWNMLKIVKFSPKSCPKTLSCISYVFFLRVWNSYLPIRMFFFWNFRILMSNSYVFFRDPQIRIWIRICIPPPAYSSVQKCGRYVTNGVGGGGKLSVLRELFSEPARLKSRNARNFTAILTLFE